MYSQDDTLPNTYLGAVAVLSRGELVSPALVEELLAPELRDWVEAFGERPIHWPSLHETLRSRLQLKVEKQGVGRQVAALILGMTDESFGQLIETRPPAFLTRQSSNGETRFLREELDEFASRYLPNFKTWSSRTSLLREFHRNLAAQTGFIVAPQPCEIGGCDELAALICANPNCRPDAPPRKVCIAHRERLHAPDDQSLCDECVRRVLYGDLGGIFRIVGTLPRLQRDHPR